MIYLVVNDGFDSDSINVVYATGNLAKAEEIKNRIEYTLESTLDLEEYHPDTLEGIWECINELDYDEFKYLFMKGINEEFQKRLDDNKIEITDELLYDTWLASKAELVGYDFSVKAVKVEEPFDNILDLLKTI